MEISAKTKGTSTGNKKQSPGITWLGGLLMFVALSFFAFTQSPRPKPFEPPTLFESFFKPREQNAFMRLPAISGKTKAIFALPDSDLVWLVGNNGLIMHSADAGQSWQQQSFPGGPETSPVNDAQEASFLEQISPISLAHAGMSAEDEKKQQLLELERQQQLIQQQVMQSPAQQSVQTKQPKANSNTITDEQFDPFFENDQQTEEELFQEEDPPTQAQPVDIGPADLQAVYFVNENRGVVVGDEGSILFTENGGASWQKIEHDETADLYALTFSNNENGLAVGNGGTILKTNDGGNTWLRVDSGSRSNLRSINFLDDNSALVVGDNGAALLTTDASNSWRALPATDSDSFLDAAFVNQDVLLVIHKNGNIVKGSGSQSDWKIVFRSGIGELNAITMLNQYSGYVVGKNGLILKTTDGGNSWQPQVSGTNETLIAISMIDNDNGYISGTSGTLLKTTDAGNSWQAITNGFARALFDIAYESETTAFVVGVDGTILKTNDGGKTWQPKASGTKEPIVNIALTTVNTALVVGEKGLIKKTTDGGESWQPKDSGTSTYLNGITMINALTGFVVGDSGTILKTSDGGESWKIKTSNSNKGLMRVTQINSQIALAVGDKGTILKTTDDGESWQQLASNDTNTLFGVTLVDINQGFTVGDNGTLLKTNNSGDSWQPINTGSDSFLIDISMTTDGGIIVGDNGTILKSDDGGVNWQAIANSSKQMLINLAMFDAKTGIAVGSGATIFKTSDGGKSWSLPEYKRYPAYWYWFTCGFFALFALGIAQHKPEQKETEVETVADILASDRPIEPGDPDPLDFGAIARGLSRFMRNPKTEPPLTVAITGAWGTGKSSLMNLLYYDLKKNGFTPVWFNAWHHQKGEQLLASLYANIRTQAVPSWFSILHPFTGLIFRLNLFFCRSKKHWIVAVLLTSLFTTSLLYLYQQPIMLDGFDLAALFQSIQKSDDLFNVLLALLGGIPPVAALLRSLRAFGINPANLSTAAGNEKRNANGVDPSARHRLAAEFKDVTKSLVLGRMVIFIDDLDRCSKENVVDILESINFLAVSGDCYIILGMDKGWVQICITEQFTEMAKDNPRFAEEYLEKLINIEVPVPIMAEDGSGKLLSPETSEPLERSGWNTATDWLDNKLHIYRSMLTLVVLLIMGVSTGFGVTYWYQNGESEPSVESSTTVTTWDNIEIVDIDISSGKPSFSLKIGDPAALEAKAPNEVAIQSISQPEKRNWQLVLKANDEALEQGLPIAKLGDKSASAELLLRLIKEPSKAVASIQSTAVTPPVVVSATENPGSTPGLRNTEASTAWWAYPISGLTILALVFGLLAFVLRKPSRIENDSPRFKQALNIWHPWITLNRQTPRAIKRYLNRVRYLAMRYREEVDDDQTKSSLLSRLFRKHQQAQVNENEVSIDESTLVALSAIFAVDESWIIDNENFRLLGEGQLNALIQAKYPNQFTTQNDPKIDGFMRPLVSALNAHQETFGHAIFENTDERQQFLHILAAANVN